MKKTRVMYHGERVGILGHIYHLFKERKGKEHHFTGSFRRVCFGDVYTMEGNSLKRAPDPVLPQPWEPTDQELHQYEAAKVSVRHQRELRKKDMKLRQPNEKIVQAVKLLRPFYQAMTDMDRRRFMGWVANECSRKGRK